MVASAGKNWDSLEAETVNISGTRVLSFGLVVALIWLVPLSVARATNFSGITGATGCTALNQADNASHSYQYIDLSSYMDSATDYARANAIDPTDVNTVIDGTPDALTDVLVRDRYYDDYCGYNWWTASAGGVIGLATCDSLSPTSRCEQHTVRYSNVWGDGASTSHRRWLSCHENGHSLGLTHRDAFDSCMTPSPLPTIVVLYSGHDIAHLNAAY